MHFDTTVELGLAVKAYNAVSLVREALRSEWGEERVEELSWYHLCSETATVWGGMDIAVEAKEWSRLIDGLSIAAYAKLLQELAGRMNIAKYKKARRGPRYRQREKTAIVHTYRQQKSSPKGNLKNKGAGSNEHLERAGVNNLL